MLSVAGGLGDQPGPAQGVGQRSFRGRVASAAPVPAAGTTAPAAALRLAALALATLALATRGITALGLTARAAACLAGRGPGHVVVQAQGERDPVPADVDREHLDPHH